MEAVFTLCIMGFLGITAILSLGQSKETIAGDQLGAGGFPLIMVVLGLILCTILLVKQLKSKKKTHERLLDLSTPAGKAIALNALVLAIYLAVMNLFGFILSTLIYAFSAARVTGYRKYGKLVLFSFLTTIGLFLLFGKAFFVPLPRGVGILKELSYLLY